MSAIGLRFSFAGCVFNSVPQSFDAQVIIPTA